jgi:hypothetical protein
MNEETIIKLTKDLRESVASMTTNEVRYLVDSYYQMQENRLRSAGQIRSMEDPKEPHRVLSWLEDNATVLETQIQKALDYYSASHPVGIWMRSVKGIGPVIAAGLLAHIDITKAPTVGHIWRFAGQDPTSKWTKGEKRPWNASLKVICWKIGESFVKVSNHADSDYGFIYRERKAYEAAKNEAGDYAEQAAAVLERTPKHAQRKIYKTGKLPPGHLNSRAKRYAVKQFLSDMHAFWYRHHFQCEPPKPYPIAILGHAHERKAA